MNNPVQYIEEQLGITLEKYDYKKEDQMHTYRVWQKDQTLRELVIQDIVIENINVLYPLSEHLHTIKLINCTVHNIVAMYSFKGLCNLTLDNVVINDLDKLYPRTDHENFDGYLRQVNLLNMEVRHLSMFFPLAHKLDNVFITNCTLHNFYEVNLFPKLYDLRLTNVKIKPSEKDVIYTPQADRNFTWLSLTKMEFEDIDFFLPIVEGIHGIHLNGSQIGSIASLVQLPYLEVLEMDSKTRIIDQKLPIDTATTFRIKECTVGENHENEKAIFDINNLLSLAPYIQSISFSQYVSHMNDALIYFSNVDKLVFHYSSVFLEDFIPIASQIKTIRFEQSGFTDSSVLKHFSALEQLGFSIDPHQKGLRDFKKLSPLKHQLKRLDIDEDNVENIEVIKDFTALESLRLWEVTSLQALQNILSLSSLSKLFVWVSIEPELTETITLSLKALQNIKELSFSGSDSYEFIDTAFLKQLTSLTLLGDCKISNMSTLQQLEYLEVGESIDVNTLPSIPSLKTLKLEVIPDYEIYSLAHFPNLEHLKIENTSKIHLKNLPKLKILCIQCNGDTISEDAFDGTPNLEQLDLSDSSLHHLKSLKSLQKLRVLDLSGNYLENIEGLKHLQNLELLNLHANELKKVDVLNKLSSIKEVNLSGNNIEDEAFLDQLEKPEIAVFMGVPRSPFYIWGDRHHKLE
ncbi:leucine-rich repeat domain-containing protein [Aquimarina sp. 433]